MLTRMASRAQWAKRVADWRGSGLTSEEFCAGKGFTAGGLRNAAHTLEREGVGSRQALAVPMARVVRASLPAARASLAGARASAPRRAPDASSGDVELMVEVAGARVSVRRGCDRATLTTVLEALAQVGGAR